MLPISAQEVIHKHFVAAGNFPKDIHRPHEAGTPGPLPQPQAQVTKGRRRQVRVLHALGRAEDRRQATQD